MPLPTSNHSGPTGRLELLILGAVFLAGLGSALVWLATAQRAWAGVMFERRVFRQEPMAPETPIRIRERLRGLEAAWLPGLHLHLPGLAAQLALQEEGLSASEREALFAQGRLEICLGLARDPARSHAWARLASFRMLAGASGTAVVAALRMSIYTAPAMHSLVFWRIRTAGRCRAHWDGEFERLIKRQIVLASRISKQRLESSVAGTAMETFTRQVLAKSGAVR